jgi:hypothetical protein
LSGFLDFKQKVLLSGVFVMSWIDAVLTLLWIKLSMAEELNPLLERFLEIGPLYFILSKLGLTSLGCLVLYLYREKQIAQRAATGLFVFYAGLLIYHCFGSIIILLNH